MRRRTCSTKGFRSEWTQCWPEDSGGKLRSFTNRTGNILTEDAHGIFQSIGLKEFIPYLQMEPEQRESPEGIELFNKGCDLLKVHTKQYSRRQRNWVKNRIMMRTTAREVPQLLNLDASRDFFERVVPFAVEVVRRFLAGTTPLVAELDAPLFPLIENPELSPKIAHMDYDLRANRIHYCELCAMEVQSDLGMESHIRGKIHRLAIAKARRAEREKKRRELESETLIGHTGSAQ